MRQILTFFACINNNPFSTNVTPPVQYFFTLFFTNLTFLYLHAGDIDPEFNVVEVTEEAKAELAKIENKIGDFICRLCKEIYDDAFGLAQHR